MNAIAAAPAAASHDARTAPCGACPDTAWQEAARRACASIMPTWPLDQAVAVNPHWHRVDKPIRTVAARLGVLGGFQVFPARDYIRTAWTSGRIGPADLDLALKRVAAREPVTETAAHCIAALSEVPAVRHLPLVVDLLDAAPQQNRRWPWRSAIVFQISQTCATYFDRQQAEWRASGSQSLYGFWRESMTGDHGLSARLGLPGFMNHLRALPPDAESAMRWALAELALADSSTWQDYFEALLLSINGWAAWCAYIAWQKAAEGRGDTRLRELLACRIAWEALLARAAQPAERADVKRRLNEGWHGAQACFAKAGAALVVDEIWQHALEIGFQRHFACTLCAHPTQLRVCRAQRTVPDRPEVQAVFCIDTRSERMRRSLEAIWPAIETRAFAGFFGIPMKYSPLGSAMQRPQLPGLAYPSVAVQDIVSAEGRRDADPELADKARCARRRHLAGRDQWLGAVRWSNTTFSFVEAFGVGYLGRIGRWILPSAAKRVDTDRAGLPAALRDYCRPVVTGLDAAGQVNLAAGILRTMGLNDRLAPLVVLCGHAGQCANNAHASTLDCGACYGRPGEANARALAHLLNDPSVREGLHVRGLHIPPDTVFMGALHNTTTDEVTGFDLDLLTPQARAVWEKMAHAFTLAGEQMRRERAPVLQMDAQQAADVLLTSFRRRANDGAQTRPEWGLTRNAAFIIGPRTRSRNRVLNRTYLHDYDATLDPDGSLLETLMMGPMLVTHWLSWQYHASTCDPLHYGAGNKVLHNVVGGRIGVFEGNGGDLRIGLPKQSLHDGNGWYHEPVRLTVVIDAPATSIRRAMARNPVLVQLCDNGWLLLWRYEGDTLQRYDGGRWLPLDVLG